ncbi:AI-2E family transporter [Streptosporangiaceae bacterium NEAU-GS5]|nr:AI-2E family transporter [Streptosporangiaceae bacterium NEAU-GS5]
MGGSSRGLRMLIGGAAGVVVLAGLRAVGDVAGAAFLALTLTIAVSPLRIWLRRRGAPLWVIVAVPLLVVVLILIALLASVVVSVAQLADVLPQYASQYAALVRAATAELNRLGITQDQINAALAKLDPAQLVGLVQSFLASLLSVISMVLLITLLLYGMSMDAPMTERGLARLAPPVREALSEFGSQTVRYLVVSSVFGLIVAVLDALALWVLGVPLPLLWGLLAFITNYIPNIGFIIGLVPPALLGLLDSGVGTMLMVVVIYCVLNFVIQSLIQPKYAGRSAGLSTTLTIVSLLVWTYVLGAVGAILAVPLSSFARALLIDSDPATRWARPLIDGTDVR